MSSNTCRRSYAPSLANRCAASCVSGSGAELGGSNPACRKMFSAGILKAFAIARHISVPGFLVPIKTLEIEAGFIPLSLAKSDCDQLRESSSLWSQDGNSEVVISYLNFSIPGYSIGYLSYSY